MMEFDNQNTLNLKDEETGQCPMKEEDQSAFVITPLDEKEADTPFKCFICEEYCNSQEEILDHIKIHDVDIIKTE